MLWLDATTLIPEVADGNDVPSWTDRSGNAFTFSASSLGSNSDNTNPKLPSFVLAEPTLNNLPVVRFDGGNSERLVLNAFAAMPTDEITVIIVTRETGIEGAGSAIVSYAVAGSSNEYLILNRSNGVLKTFVNGDEEGSGDLTGGFKIFSSRWRKSNRQLVHRLNGNIESSVTNSSNSSMTAGGTLALGGEQDAVDGDYATNQDLEGDIAEIILFNGYINDAQAVIIENYLSAKYGIAISSLDAYTNATYIYDVSGIGKLGANVHATVGSTGLYLQAASTPSLNNGDFVMMGHGNGAREVSASDLSGTSPTVTDRWERDWYVEKTSLTTVGSNIYLEFDFPEGVVNGGLPQDISGYKLLYRSGSSGNYSVAATTNVSKVGGDRIRFELTEGQLTNGYYTIGTSDNANSPIIGAPAKTWYSYQDGNWDDFNTWTLDGAALPSFENPTSQVPASEDNVIITSGNTVSVTTDGKVIRNIEITGDLDVTTSVNHQLGTITGNGFLLMQGSSAGVDNFPDGDASGFADATNGGTVKIYGNGLALNQTRTFNNLQIALSGSANEVVLLKNYILNGNFTIERGTFRINDGTQTTNLTATVRGNTTIDNAGLIQVSSSNARHQLNLYGDLINNGDIAFTNRTVPNYGSESGNGIVDVNFLSSTENQNVECNGPSRFYRIKIDKGIDETYVLSLEANNSNNFKLLGAARDNHPQSAQLSDNRNALGLVRGTVRIGNNINIPVLNDRNNYNVSEAAQLWVDGGTVSKTDGEAIVLYGKARVSAGTLNALVRSGFTLRDNGTVTVDGGELNANQIRTSVVGVSSLGGYVQSGGITNVLGTSINGDYYVFNLTYPGNVFTMSGGELNIKQANGKGGVFINSAPENINVTEGIVNLELGSNNDMIVTSRAPFYNVNVRNPNGYNKAVVLNGGTDVSSTDESLAAQPLVVLNNLTLEENARLTTNNQNVTIGRNFTISNDALYDFGTNTTIFNSNKNATLFIGDITGVTNGNYIDPEGEDAYARWEQPFYNFTVNKPGATLTLATSSTYTTTDAVFHDGSGRKNIRGWRNNLMKVANNFILEKGTIDLDLFSVRLYGDVTNRGVFGVDFDPLNAQVKLRRESTPTNRTITTAKGAEFGNLRFNSDQATVSITSDLYIKRFEYKHGRFNIRTYNLRIDQLDIGLENNAQFDFNGDGDTNDGGERSVFSPADMFVTAGNASDGGVSMLINGDGTYRFPFGIGTGATELLANGAKYTPATVTVSNFSDDGYITINPVDEILGTTNINGDDLLSYYWRIRHSDFASLPTVVHQFAYNEEDLDASVNEASFVAGSVLSTLPYTRSGEDFEDSDGDGALGSGEGTAEVSSVNETSNLITFDGSADSGFTLQEANYTAGQETRFLGAVRVYYTRRDGNWNSTNTWSTVGHYSSTNNGTYPQDGDIAFIGFDPNSNTGGASHWIQLNVDVDVAEIVFAKSVKNSGGTEIPRDQQWLPQLIVRDERGAINLGKISGEGTFNVEIGCATCSADPNVTIPRAATITADFGDFANERLSRFDYDLENNAAFRLPLSFPEVYPNMHIKGQNSNNNRVLIIQEDIQVKRDLIVREDAVLRLNDGTNGDITVERNINFTINNGDDVIEFPTTGANRVLRVGGNIVMDDGTDRIRVRNDTPSGLEHCLQVGGNIQQGGNNIIDLYNGNAASDNRAVLELTGTGAGSYTRTTGSPADLYRVVLNKGTGQDSTFTFADDFTLGGATNGPTKALELKNGTLILDDADIDIDLTTGGDNFLIPSSAALEVRNGTVNVGGDNTGILLAGTLRISGANAKVDMNDNVGNGNNYIEYSVGNPTLEISAGTLTVGAQIRRVLNDGTGALNYVQTGGSVTIGRQAIATPRPASENDRGMLEVINGGQFVHTSGELKIVRSNNSPSVATLFLDPGTFDVTGSEIILGDGNSPANDLYRINSSIPLHQLTINNASSKNPRAELFVRPLTVNDRLTITSGATLDAGVGSLTLTLNDDLVNDGLYVPNGNLTVLGSSGAQQITGSTATEFYDLDKTGSGTTTLQQPILVTRHLRMLDGTMADNGNTVEVRGNVTHDAIHTSAGGEGIVFAGTAQQQLTRSLAGASTFGIISVRNANGVIIPESNGFDFQVNDQLRLEQGVFNIGSSSLTLLENAHIEAVNAFGINNMVRTNSSFADSGLKKVFLPNTSTNFTFPVGEDVYSPATVDFTSVGGSVGASGGSIAIVPNRRFHPVVDDGSEATLPNDLDNVLQYYWAIRTENLSNFTGNIVFNYDQSDVALGTDTGGDPYTEDEYLSARILTLGGNTSVDKFTPTLVDETNNLITFEFSGQGNNGIYGDYFAGIDLAIPDDIPVFTSTGNSTAYNDPAAWTIDPPSTPFPAGGPRGSSIIVIQNAHTINFNRNRINVYKTEIELGGTVTLGTTTQHDLGIVSGQGTISTQTGTLPAGLYKDFFTCTGGELAYEGTGNYSVFKGGISSLRRVTFAGSGQRTFPNQASINICQDVIVDGPSVINPSGGGISNIAVGDDLYVQTGVFQTGSSIISVGNDLLVEGTYSGQNNHQNTVGGDVRISGGSFSVGNGGTIRIGGDFDYSSGTFNSGSSSSCIVMQGISPQTITGTFTGTADINHLEIKNGTGVTMGSGSSITIDNKLTLTNGILTPGGNKLLLDADAVVGSNKEGSATSYVNGTLCKIIVDGNEFVFPIGDGTRWGHTSVKPTTTAAHEWCAQYYDDKATNHASISNLDPSIAATLPPHDIKTISNNEYWRITSDIPTAPGLSAKVGLRWDTKSSVSPDPNDWYTLKVMEWNGSAWDSHGGTGHESNPSPTQSKGSFTATSNIDFLEKYVTIGSASEANQLPVELISFTANAQEQTVQLVWETASEINNDYFEVRRSVDGINFNKIGEVAGNGNTVDVIRYEFVDQMPVSGISYYQLKQVDFDGAFEHSDKISVEWINAGFVAGFVEVNLYPNPAPQGQAKLKVTGLRPHSTVTFKLLDMFGKPYMQQVLETDMLSQQGFMIQPRTRLATGVYVVSVQQGSEVHQKTLIVR